MIVEYFFFFLRNKKIHKVRDYKYIPASCAGPRNSGSLLKNNIQCHTGRFCEMTGFQSVSLSLCCLPVKHFLEGRVLKLEGLTGREQS